ncbi:hypothetical protein KP79_PYT08500 [Mizuhopecten yessoensis]|uniref:Uncharacterized protein n=1 Tax=Mizuhopecten yessoensis TaxID=6573 RepID=A0A210PEA3_MIZYE|nr:hypothetical protein KP79_PYT08500 [Mizuhopecten yessoensis]
MSTHKSIKTSLERAKTSLGLKSSNRERMESVSELMMALESERQLEQVMMNSVEKWTEIVDEITTNMDSATTSESEWKTRFHDQRLFNQMLTKEIGQIKTELYMLKQGDAGMTLPVMGESESSSSSNSRQSQVYIKSLEEKLKSLESKRKLGVHTTVLSLVSKRIK